MARKLMHQSRSSKTEQGVFLFYHVLNALLLDHHRNHWWKRYRKAAWTLRRDFLRHLGRGSIENYIFHFWSKEMGHLNHLKDKYEHEITACLLFGWSLGLLHLRTFDHSRWWKHEKERQIYSDCRMEQRLSQSTVGPQLRLVMEIVQLLPWFLSKIPIRTK